MAWNALGAQIGLLIALITVPTLAVLAALADRHFRRNMAVAKVSRIENAGESFEIALRAALYRGRLRRSSVLCIIVELGTPRTQLDAMSQAERTYQNAVFIGSFLRRRDQVFVLGPEKFGMVLNAGRLVTADEALTLAKRLKKDMKDTSIRSRSTGLPDALVGVSVSPKDTVVVARDLIRAAGKALRSARASYTADVQLQAPYTTKDDQRTGILRRDIGLALEGHEFRGWFQPQICTVSGRVTGFETLARWEHPSEGVVPPSKFLPILQRRGMMPLLQERMLSEALTGFETWSKLTDDPPAVGLNVAPEDLLDPTLPDRIIWELDRRKIDPRHLTIEILETVVAQSPDDVTALNIQRLSEIGCGIDLDDFGAGHASISSLRQFKLNRLKIDRSFIQGIDSNPDQENMVSAILIMAQHLGLDTVAEGIENQDEQSVLARLGCGHLQGFGIARPMPLDEVVKWLELKTPKAELAQQEHSRAS
ncbi:MAG: GGDEF domain-containing phosphodiesterase [Pseudomonadota bacterium]